jgi:hypothetical protein
MTPGDDGQRRLVCDPADPEEQVLFGAVMHVERGWAHPRAGRDVPGGGAVKSLRGEQAEPGDEQSACGFRLNALPQPAGPAVGAVFRRDRHDVTGSRGTTFG